MSHKIKKDIQFQIEEIDMLFEMYEKELFEIKDSPNLIELTAFASVLHSFYNGIENIFTLIAKEIDKSIPTGNNWHKELLIQISSDSSNRKAMISDKTKEYLLNYLAFRHFYRHAYSFHLEWEEMEDLIIPMRDIWKTIKTEINNFIEKQGL